jgi:hypothetical protein
LTVPPGATGAGSATVICCNCVRASARLEKRALASLADADLISAAGLMRAVKELPSPCPTLRAVSSARAASVRSAPGAGRLAVISNCVICHAARASSCAAAFAAKSRRAGRAARSLKALSLFMGCERKFACEEIGILAGPGSSLTYMALTSRRARRSC